MSICTATRPVFSPDWYETRFSLAPRPEEDVEEYRGLDFVQAPALKRFRARMLREYLDRLASRKQEVF
jgi:hypothetical protein